jgi:hypothetical protein
MKHSKNVVFSITGLLGSIVVCASTPPSGHNIPCKDGNPPPEGYICCNEEPLKVDPLEMKPPKVSNPFSLGTIVITRHDDVFGGIARNGLDVKINRKKWNVNVTGLTGEERYVRASSDEQGGCEMDIPALPATTLGKWDLQYAVSVSVTLGGILTLSADPGYINGILQATYSEVPAQTNKRPYRAQFRREQRGLAGAGSATGTYTISYDIMGGSGTRSRECPTSGCVNTTQISGTYTAQNSSWVATREFSVTDYTECCPEAGGSGQ